jgi:hypothetical protein
MAMKKLNLALMLSLSCLFTSTLYAAEYSGGSGINESPYRISSAADWQELMGSPADWGSYFVLTGNISLFGVAQTPVGTQAAPFTGVFDGNGFTISFVGIEMTTTNEVGLFGYVSNGQIKNLSLTHVMVSGQYQVGGLCGWNSGAITNCSVIGTISGVGNVGGLCGYNQLAVFRNCYAAGIVYGTAGSFGGLCGYTNYGGFVDCYATNSVSGDNHVGGLCGYSYRGSAANCYSAGVVNGTTNIGGMFGWAYYTSSSSPMSNCFWDTQASGQNSGIGYGDIDGVTPKTTIQMQTQATFTDAGWDFTDTDGDAADWQMPTDSYPRFGWETWITFSPDGGTYQAKQQVTVTCSAPDAVIHYSTKGVPTESDSVIESGTSILISKALPLYAAAWRNGSMACLKSANYVINRICPEGDLNGDCKVDLNDFALLSQWWLEICDVTNGWCGGVDLDASGVVDLGELEDVVSENLKGEDIADHVIGMAIDMEWDYQNPDNPNVSYNFQVSVDTDETVALISFTTPTGLTFVIPAMDKVWDIPEPNGLLTLGVESYIPGEYNWEYRYKFSTLEPLSAYGDGLYTITVYYTDGGTQQTTVWFGIPGTTDPLPQPTQEPVFISIHDGDTVSSPVTFTWEACTDPAVDDIYFMTISWETGWPDQYFLTPQAVGLYTPIAMTPGIYSAFLTFISGDDGWDIVNDDGVPYSAYKSCGSYCTITVE